MFLIEKQFENKSLNLTITSYIDNKQNVYFKGKDIALVLGYVNTNDAILTHVDDEDKKKMGNLRGRDSRPLTWNEKNTCFINESGLYSLILSSKLDSAKCFKRWVTSLILPSIRKYGYFRTFNNPKTLTFKIEDEYDLHTKVVNFIRRFYPKAIIIAGIGENQDTANKRISSYKKGYMKGQPDLIIQNRHKDYNGLVFEFKTPQGNGIVSNEQKDLLEQYEANNYKCLVSHDYDLIIKTINDYMTGIRLKCKYCKRNFVSHITLNNHYKHFHKID